MKFYAFQVVVLVFLMVLVTVIGIVLGILDLGGSNVQGAAGILLAAVAGNILLGNSLISVLVAAERAAGRFEVGGGA